MHIIRTKRTLRRSLWRWPRKGSGSVAWCSEAKVMGLDDTERPLEEIL